MKSLPKIFLVFILAALPVYSLVGQDVEPKSEDKVKKKEPAEQRNPFESAKSTPQLEFSVSLSPQDALPGDTVTLTIKTKIEAGWHIYALGDDESVGGIGDQNPSSIAQPSVGRR